MNLGHPFLIFHLCKQAGVHFTNQEDLFHPIKSIVVRKRKGGPEPQVNIDFSHKATSEEEDEAKEEAIEPTVDCLPNM